MLLLRWMPAETRQHLIAARKERLLALRSLLDSWIARLEAKAQVAPSLDAAAAQPRRRGGRRRPGSPPASA